MTEQTFAPPAAEPGRATAMLVYGLYLLSIPSLAVFALIGVIIAYVARDGASLSARQHLNEQIRIWWIAFAWSIVLIVVSAVGWMLAFLLIGFPIIWLAALAGLVVMIWFTIKSALGLITLINQRTA